MIYNKNQKKKYIIVLQYFIEINVLKIKSCNKYSKLNRNVKI